MHEQSAAASCPGGKRHIIDSRLSGSGLPPAAASGSSKASANVFPSSSRLSGLTRFTEGEAQTQEVACLHLC